MQVGERTFIEVRNGVRTPALKGQGGMMYDV